MQGQVINISISRIYLVLLAEFGGKGERQEMNFEGLTPSHFLDRTLGADVRNNYGFISGEIIKGDRIDPVDRI
jgi:hypothetical protein